MNLDCIAHDAKLIEMCTPFIGRIKTEIEFHSLRCRQEVVEFFFLVRKVRVVVTRISQTSRINFVSSPPIGVRLAGKGDNLYRPLLKNALRDPGGR